jgi:hypothetical protein
MFGTFGYDAVGRWQPPPQDRRPSSAAPVADAIIDIEDINNGIIVNGIGIDDNHDDDGEDDGCKTTIGEGGGGTLAPASGGGVGGYNRRRGVHDLHRHCLWRRLAVPQGGGASSWQPVGENVFWLCLLVASINS